MGNLKNKLVIPGPESDELLELVLKKEYKSEALGFITDNKSRVINYWESKDMLPIKSPKEKHKRYSFIELVWLNIVKLLKDFGFDFVTIQKIKKTLLNTVIIEKAMKDLTEDPVMMQFVAKYHGTTTQELQEQFKEAMLHKEEFGALKTCELTFYIMEALRDRQQINLLFHQDGSFFPYPLPKKRILEESNTFNEFISVNHVSFSLNHIINFHLPKEYIKDPIRRHILTEDELAILEVIKKKNLKSVEITFNDDNKIELINSKVRKKADLNQRLHEIIMDDLYQDIQIKVEGGKIVHCIKSVKKKLSKK